jgi:hypothetical protein
MSDNKLSEYDARIMEQLDALLETHGRAERMEVRDGHLYFEGMTVLEHWADWLDEDEWRPASWVCTDHNNPDETRVSDHIDHCGEKWSGSINVWANFVNNTLCMKEGCGWTGDYRDESAWVFDPVANPPRTGQSISVSQLASLL